MNCLRRSIFAVRELNVFRSNCASFLNDFSNTFNQLYFLVDEKFYLFSNFWCLLLELHFCCCMDNCLSPAVFRRLVCKSPQRNNIFRHETDLKFANLIGRNNNMITRLLTVKKFSIKCQTVYLQVLVWIVFDWNKINDLEFLMVVLKTHL